MRPNSLFLIFTSLVLIAVGQDQQIGSLFPDMETLTDQNIDITMSSSGADVWLVVFYVPWCEHTKLLVPQLQAVASDLLATNYNMKFGAVDVSVNKQLGWKYQIDRSPFIKIFSKTNGQWSTTDYAGDGKQASISDFCMEFYKGTNIPYSNIPDEFKDGDVIELDEGNFDEVVFNSNEIWMLKFSAPWCYHCNLMKPNWAAAAKEMGANVRFAVINADVNRSLARRFMVKMLPTIKFYHAGYGKNDGTAQTYQEGRSLQDVLNFAKNLRAEFELDPTVYAYESNFIAPVITENNQALGHHCDDPTCSIMPEDPNLNNTQQ